MGQRGYNCDVFLTKCIQNLIADILLHNYDVRLNLSHFLTDDLNPMFFLIDYALYLSDSFEIVLNRADRLFQEQYLWIFNVTSHPLISYIFGQYQPIYISRFGVILPIYELNLDKLIKNHRILHVS